MSTRLTATIVTLLVTGAGVSSQERERAELRTPGSPLTVAPRSRADLTLRPGALAELIDQLGGTTVRMPQSRVAAVLNPRVLLIESATRLPPSRQFNRLLVMIERGELRLDAATLVGTNVTVFGVARTLLGLKVTGEAAWPRALTPQVLERYDIRAGVVASSIKASDEIELIVRPPAPAEER